MSFRLKISFRTKILIIIVGITAMVVVTTIGSSLYFMRSGIEQTIMSDITVIRDITNELISSEISLIKSKATASANRLKASPMDRWNIILKEEVDGSDIFRSITVFERGGLVIAGYGQPQTPADLLFSEASKKAFNGQSTITTTRLEADGELVFHVFVPLAQMILSATIPGMYFTEMLEKFRIWGNGSLFIIDNEGTIIANRRHYFVLNRYNSLWDPSQEPDVLSLQTFTRRMLRNHDGTGRYILEGVERLGVYVHITASASGWVLGVSAPISESPAAFLDRALLVMTFVFLGLGALLAFFASAFVDKQFRTINEQYANLSELSEIAQHASDAKSHFLANMSHEMRTPLNAIIGFSELILHGHSDAADLEEELRKIHLAGLTLLGLVNDILDISKIESGKFELVNVDYDLASVINDTVTVNLVRIGEKPITFGLNIDKDLPSRLFGDEMRLKQIMNNLLSNAFKYTMEGDVDLAVTGRRDGDSVWLTIKVTDTGIGIKPEDIDKLFSDYSQVDTKSNRKIEGTGLGLSITRKLLALMDGNIKVESVYGQGSCFTVTLRQQFVTSVPIGSKVVENLESMDNSYKEQVHNDVAFTRMPYARVLVVDDVQANLDVARGMLKPYGMQIDCATSGQKAVDLIMDAKVRYQAIFMDHMMPGMDGIEAVKRIREIDTEYAREIPIIALTANAIVGNEQMFLANGFQAFLSKPIELRRMDMVLKQWVRDREKEAKFLAEQRSEAEELERLVTTAMSGGGRAGERRQAATRSVGASGGGASGGGVSGGSAPGGAGTAGGGNSGGGTPGGGTPGGGLSAGPSGSGSSAAVSWSGSAAAPPPPGSIPARQPDPGSAAARDANSIPPYHVDGIDLQEGLKRFSGDRQVYYEVLKSYRDSVAELIGQLRDPRLENLRNYTIVVHGLKSSSYGVCAMELGQMAEMLERKADGGDLEYVLIHNPTFLESVERMMGSLDALFENVQATRQPKPLKDAPDPTILARLREACRNYDMDGVDSAIDELDGFSYSSDPELTAWLKDRAEEMDLQRIIERFPQA
jgi:signal transduction histidine kinase/FixJ family two-component response regulator